ncbi:MAG TPA: hypothetical protein VFH48_10145 [Chloroflexota bacterium]|nr:hypothetical protein [Chloroflexota bacterium]
MNILDEDIRADQRELLRRHRIAVRQIGHDIAQKGIKDQAILPFLHGLRRPTFFTRDRGFYDGLLCHPGYCLVWLDVNKSEVADFIRRVLRHPLLSTQAKRMGLVIRVSSTDLHILRRHSVEEAVSWPK